MQNILTGFDCYIKMWAQDAGFIASLSGSRPSGKCESNRRAFSGVSYESKQQNLIEKRKNLGKIESNKRGMQSKSLR